MYRMYFLVYSNGAKHDSAEPGTWGNGFGKDDAPARSIQKATATDRFTLIPLGCCTFQSHSYSSRLQLLPDPPIFHKAAATARSTLIP